MSRSSLDLRREVLGRVREHYRLQAVQYADRAEALVALAEAYGSDERSLLLDLAGSARMGQVRAGNELDRAKRLVGCYPSALARLRDGSLGVPVVEQLLRATKHCSEKVHARLGLLLPNMLAGLDMADAYRLIERTIPEVEAQVEADAQQQRHAKAKANRGVWVFDTADGMARVGAEVDALSARRFALDFGDLVRAETVRDKRDGVKRTAAQRRADVLMELPARYRLLLEAVQAGKADSLRAQALARRDLAASRPSAQAELPLDLPLLGRPRLDELDTEELAIELLRQPLPARSVLYVHQAMTSLLGLDQTAALVEGGGYLPAFLGRLLMPDAALQRVVVNAETGIPVYLDPDQVTSHLQRPGRPPDAPPGPGRRRPRRPPGVPPVPGQRPPSDASPDPIADTGPPLPTVPDGLSPAALIAQELIDNELRLAAARACQDALLSMVTPVQLRDTTEPHHDPSTRLRRLVEIRDLRCIGPGCRRAARHCELDHEDEYGKGGPTAEPNLSAKSPRCHHARHDDGWTAHRDPRTGVTTWTSPTGARYERLPAWVRHPSHDPVVRLGLTETTLPTADTDYPEDRPLWRPRPVPTQPNPAPQRVSPRPTGGPSWDDGPPPF